jgi:hypothetical protein
MNNSSAFFALEALVTLIAVTVALFWPHFGARLSSRSFRSFSQIARKPGLSVLLVAAAALVGRLAILPLVPIPNPFIHDEFANLLAGDTFASGRLTNPTHPMWRYFESFHITQLPGYMSMYFPAPGLILALGKILTGNPWFGMWLTSGLMCAAMCWMFYGWLPPRWALLGGVLVVIRLGLFSYWVNSYYGGAIPAIGGALVLGALPRLLRKRRLRDGLWMALGIAALANSRPYEGVLLCVPVCAALFTRVRLPKRVVLLPALVLIIVAAMDGYYNHRVFGNALTLPYQINRATYASAPVFIWQAPRPQPAYRYRVMREFYSKWEMGDFLEARSLDGFVRRETQKIGTVLFFICGFTLMPPLIMLPRALRDRRMRILVVAGIVFAVGVSLNAWLFPHYIAPFACGLYVLLLQGMRHMRTTSKGAAILRTTFIACGLLAIVRLFAPAAHIGIPRWPTMWYGSEPLGIPRANVEAALESRPGLQLAIVRYALRHAPFDDWVYNAADIDKAKVVWAREAENTTQPDRDLLKYFSDRQAWLVEPDVNPPRITPYPTADATPINSARKRE